MNEQTEPGGLPSAADDNAKDANPGLSEVTLGERGPLLSLGVPDSTGKLHKGISVRPWKGKTMRELGRLREENQQATMAEHVPLVLTTMCTQLGPHDLPSLKPKEQKLIISQMHMGDVFHAYCWTRLQSLGHELFIDLTCPVCRLEFAYEGDLRGLTLTVADEVKDACWEYELLDPIELRGQEVKALIMGPALWHHVEKAQVEGSFDLEGGKLAIVAGVIHGIVGRGEFPLTDDEIDELTGRDIENIIGQLDKQYIGPDMRIVTKCARKGCRGKINQPLNWSYQDFFGSSSRSPTKKKSTTSSGESPTSRRVA